MDQIVFLESQWKIYRDACYPSGLDALQETETRQAFFAGCLIVLKFATESVRFLPKEKAQEQIFAMIMEAQTVCSQRITEMKGRN